PGDSIREIDWLSTLLLRGETLGGAMPLKRVPTSEYEGYDVRLWQPRMEIYLDVSGSMPDPRRALNAMTLAAQILSLGATRAGGWVRAALYSSEPVVYWQWCRSETEISRFLMHYIGGGTSYPFRLLSRSIADCGTDQPIRVVITDRDFDVNYGFEPENAGIFREAAERSPHFILLLHCPDPERVRHYRSQGAKVVEVPDLSDFPRLTAELTLALFPVDLRDCNGSV
ncbi:MAG: VWA domain-containing protein, partial [Planctomycetes bacterium]|nr:VWA domain-containing protein [Planctomycetota bacterium]